MNVILKALGNIDEKFIAESEEPLPKSNIKKLIIPIAACFAVVVCIGAWQINYNYFASTDSNKEADGDGCASEQSNCYDQEAYSTATGVFIVSGEQYLIVLDGGPVVMSNETGDENIFHGLKTGDSIEIEYEYIMETYPASTEIYNLTLLENGSIEDVPQDIIDSLTALNWEIDE